MIFFPTGSELPVWIIKLYINKKGFFHWKGICINFAIYYKHSLNIDDQMVNEWMNSWFHPIFKFFKWKVEGIFMNDHVCWKHSLLIDERLVNEWMNSWSNTFFEFFERKILGIKKKISKKTNGSIFALETSMLADSCSNWYTSLKCLFSNSLFNGHQIWYIEHAFISILRIFHFSMKGGEIHMAHISQFWRFAQLWKLIFLWRS